MDLSILAAIAIAVTLILIYLARWRGDAGVAFERSMLALFLAACACSWTSASGSTPRRGSPGWRRASGALAPARATPQAASQ